MPKLTDTQLVILSAAAQRPNRNALPLPERIKGGAAKKVVAGLLRRGLVEEVEAKRDDPVWRETGDGHGITLVAIDAAFEALGIEPDKTAEGATEAPTTGGAVTGATYEATAPDATTGAPRRKVRAGTKQARLIEMLEAPKGASITEIVAATGWKSHSVRGAIAGTLKKKLGLTVTSEKDDSRGRVYRIGR